MKSILILLAWVIVLALALYGPEIRIAIRSKRKTTKARRSWKLSRTKKRENVCS